MTDTVIERTLTVALAIIATCIGTLALLGVIH